MASIPGRSHEISNLAFDRVSAHARELYNLRVLTWLQGRGGQGLINLELEARLAFSNAMAFEAQRAIECAAVERRMAAAAREYAQHLERLATGGER